MPLEIVLLILLATAFKAVADTLQHHFSTSIFKNLNPKFWNPAVSWEHVKFLRFTRYRPDAWHLANTGMICCFIAMGSRNILEFIVLGILFNMWFSIFYDDIFPVKKEEPSSPEKQDE